MPHKASAVRGTPATYETEKPKQTAPLHKKLKNLMKNISSFMKKFDGPKVPKAAIDKNEFARDSVGKYKKAVAAADVDEAAAEKAKLRAGTRRSMDQIVL